MAHRRKPWLRTAAVAALCANVAAAQDVGTTELRPAWGDLDPFWGDLDPFWGDLDPFWGDLEPFWGDLEGFWGDLEPFWGDLEGFWGDLEGFEGTTAVRWGDLEGFWGDLEGFWGDLEGFWDPNGEHAFTPEEVARAAALFEAFCAEAEAVFGEAVEETHGASFRDAFWVPLLTRYGIDPDTMEGLGDLTPGERGGLFLAFYDGLMDHSGRDRVDWWMGAVRWSPALAQDLGSRRARIGLLDSPIGADAQVAGQVRRASGYRDAGPASAHGPAVASLIAAPHDGTGVMGVAPDARLLVHNPFDATGTAGWGDVATGLVRLERRGAHVINASIGVPGNVLSQEWATILSFVNRGDDVVYVKAAGNEGVAASDSFWLDPAANDALILVGSVGVSGRISSFSNRPGDACFVSWNGCADEDRVMNRFMVAPGELVLTDAEGANVRRSGTSFAAPLVSGTIGLMQARWPWLEQHAATTADIVLATARDLGDPGVDAVYGHGLLDVEAAVSPLSWDGLYQVRGRGADARRVSLGDALLSRGNLRRLTRKGTILAFEDVGETFRDFAIPLAERTTEGRSRGARGRVENQGYLFERMQGWMGSQGLGVTETIERRGYAYTFEAAPGADGRLARRATYRFAGGGELRLGTGGGLPTSLMFDADRDADPRASGAGGALSLAQGGAFMGGSVPVGAATMSFAVTANDPAATPLGFSDDPVWGMAGADAYRAMGVAAAISRPAAGAVWSVSYQALAETNGVLGTQGLGALDLTGGAVTHGLTAEARLPQLLGIDAGLSATLARTEVQEQDGLLAFDDGGLTATALAARAGRGSLFADGDRLTVSVSQPLTVEAGTLLMEGQVVSDREAGTLAASRQAFEASGARPVLFEADYLRPVLRGRARLGAVTTHDAETRETQAALSLRVRF